MNRVRAMKLIAGLIGVLFVVLLGLLVDEQMIGTRKLAVGFLQAFPSPTFPMPSPSTGSTSSPQASSGSSASPTATPEIVLLGTATTNFKGSSADRIHNIALGTKRVNGDVIQPGEEFSMLHSIGSITEAAGFREEYVIYSTGSEKDVGGGLCQVSTTMFRAAIDAGLPITERQHHRYIVSYYGAGLDATIFWPHPDLRFVNDTGFPITIKGVVTGATVTLKLYGVDDGRVGSTFGLTEYNKIPAPEVQYIETEGLEPGETNCVEHSRRGVTTRVTYRVKFADGSHKNQVFTSVYQPWQGICYVGAQRQPSRKRFNPWD